MIFIDSIQWQLCERDSTETQAYINCLKRITLSHNKWTPDHPRWQQTCHLNLFAAIYYCYHHILYSFFTWLFLENTSLTQYTIFSSDRATVQFICCATLCACFSIGYVTVYIFDLYFLCAPNANSNNNLMWSIECIPVEKSQNLWTKKNTLFSRLFSLVLRCLFFPQAQYFFHDIPIHRDLVSLKSY